MWRSLRHFRQKAALLIPGLMGTVGVNGINDRGQIVCTGEDSNFNSRALLLTPSGDNRIGADNASDAIIATLSASSASPAESQPAQIASFGHSQVSVVSTPLPGKDATSSPQRTVNFNMPRNDRLHPFATSHRHAADAATWEVIDRIFADLDN